MSPTLLALTVGLGQGLLHAVGPDHCAAMATLTSGAGLGRRRTALRTALRFALGHTLVLGGVAAFCLAVGVGLSETFERWAEVLGGAVLTAVAVAALLFPNSLRHGHPHLPGHAHGPEHRHDVPERLSAATGALMALSGVRALLLALPPLLVGGSLDLAGAAYLPGFALGILLGMGAMGLVLAEGFSRLSARLELWTQRGVALASAAVGLAWMAARL